MNGSFGGTPILGNLHIDFWILFFDNLELQETQLGHIFLLHFNMCYDNWSLWTWQVIFSDTQFGYSQSSIDTMLA